jgi:hypothetical protein
LQTGLLHWQMHSEKKQPTNTEREAEKMARRNSYSFALVPMDWAVNPPAKSALQVWITGIKLGTVM